MPVEEIQDDRYLGSMFIESSSVVCIIDCYADWCGPCKRAEPAFKKLSENFQDNYRFYKLNVDTKTLEIQKFLQENEISSIPAFLVVSEEKVIEKFGRITSLDEYLINQQVQSS